MVRLFFMERKTAIKLVLAALVGSHLKTYAQSAQRDRYEKATTAALAMPPSAKRDEAIKEATEKLTVDASDSMLLTMPEEYSVSFGSIKRLSFNIAGKRVTFTLDELANALSE